KKCLWDQQDNNDHPESFCGGESAFATLLDPNGNITVGSVSLQECSFWNSDKLHRKQRYATSWLVRLPTMQIALTIHLLRDDQEIISRPNGTPRMEGKATVEGIYEG